MPSNTEREVTEDYESNDAECRLHWFHRDTATKQDRQTSLEIFGGYIHTYKFSEAVEDEVVLDLVYEARDIGQTLVAG